jgi:hypothetical protein
MKGSALHLAFASRTAFAFVGIGGVGFNLRRRGSR